MAKTENTKDILKEAKDEIFKGKSDTVKNKFHNLLGIVDGVKARRAITIAKLDKELADAEAELARFAAMDVEEAFNTITVDNQSGVCGSNSSPQWVIQTGSGGYSTYTVAR